MYKRQDQDRDLEFVLEHDDFAEHAVPRSPWRSRALGQTPVSYTHLRAHETVLDLVCRLLLEQKNLMRTTVLD